MTAHESEGLWDARDVAAYLKASRSWVYQHAEDGTLPCVRVVGLLRFIPAQIRAFALGQKMPPSPIVALSRWGSADD
jgi:predicted DNA-binding transcriptional regulator AlpA